MTITLQLISLLILFGAAVGLTLCFVLWANQAGNRVANYYLVALLSMECMLSVVHLLIFEQFVDREKLLTVMSLQMCLGPMIYFYVNSVTQNTYRLAAKDLVHFLPTIILMAVWLFQINDSQQSHHTSAYDMRLLHRFAAWVSITVYAFLSIRVLKQHQKNVKGMYSSIEEINLRWLKVIVTSMLCLVLVAVLLDVRYYKLGGADFVGGSLQALSPLLFAIFMGWFGLRQKMFSLEYQNKQKGVLNRSEECIVANKADSVAFGQQKYRTSSLTESAASEIWSKLQRVMKDDRPYLENGLKISTLSEELNVSVNHLSETINGYAEQSFYDFVNKYRVEEAERLLSDISLNHLSVSDVGFQAGFNSDSTFFTHFKRLTSVTPKFYRKKAQQP